MAKVIYLLESGGGIDPQTFAMKPTVYQLIAVDPTNGITDKNTATTLDLSKFSEAQRIELFEMFKLMNRHVTPKDLWNMPNRRLENEDMVLAACEVTKLAIEYERTKGKNDENRSGN